MIDNLELKLSGELPVTREELFVLVDSWGRSGDFSTNDNIYVDVCEPNEKYALSNLDVSQIDDLSYVFTCSSYNGDLSKWNVSLCKDLTLTFLKSEFNNNSLKDWDISKVEIMDGTFYNSKFNGDLSNWNLISCKNMEDMFTWSEFNNNSISNWDVSNVERMNSALSNCPFDGDISFWNFNNKVDCDDLIHFNESFINKYNSGKDIPWESKEFKLWFEENRNKIKELNQGSKEEVLDFFSFDNQNIEIED